MKYIIGIDIGTTATKGVLYGEDGSEVAKLAISYPLIQEEAGQAEEDPQLIFDAVQKMIYQLSQKASGKILAISWSSQMHSLIGLGENNKLLTNSITSALESTGLDPYVGYLHTDRPGRVSLSLDMVEEFRAILADRFILTLINKKVISGKNFTVKENGAVLMDDDLRKKVLTEWQNKKKETITHPYLKEKVEWGMVPYVQAMLLARYLRGDLDGYPVFLWK